MHPGGGRVPDPRRAADHPRAEPWTPLTCSASVRKHVDPGGAGRPADDGGQGAGPAAAPGHGDRAVPPHLRTRTRRCGPRPRSRRQSCRTASSARPCGTRRWTVPVLGWFLDRLARQDVYAEMLVLNASHARRRGGPGGVALQHPHGGDHQPEPAPAAPSRGRRPAAVPQPGLRSGADRRRLRLLRSLRPDPRRRPADAHRAGPHLRPRGGGGAARSRRPPPTRSSRSTRS